MLESRVFLQFSTGDKSRATSRFFLPTTESGMYQDIVHIYFSIVTEVHVTSSTLCVLLPQDMQYSSICKIKLVFAYSNNCSVKYVTLVKLPFRIFKNLDKCILEIASIVSLIYIHKMTSSNYCNTQAIRIWSELLYKSL